MITHILKNGCNQLLQEDISYKLVSIKSEQVDKNQMTPIKLTDFLSVLVESKREDQFEITSKIMFSDSYILKFLDFHFQYAKADEVIKIFIISRRFRLTLMFLDKSKIEFQIDFLVTAIESNAFTVGFYLIKVYEEEIQRDYQRAVDALVKSFQQGSTFLKAKLHMTKMMLSLMNFNAAKELLVIL